MKIVAVADTHGCFPNLPDGDILIHAGDATMMGTLEEFNKFGEWLSTLKFEHIIFVPGNHDFLFESEFLSESRRRGILSGVTVLINEGVVIDGVNFWGSPYTLPFGGWAFMKDDNQLFEMWKYIPDKLDVLITHGPPRGMLDLAINHKNAGSPSLLERVREVKPKIHIFGHIHERYGQQYNRRTLFVNVSVVNEYYKNINSPLIYEIKGV